MIRSPKLIEQEQIRLEIDVYKGVKIAESLGYGYSKFKRIISPYLSRDNDEDQWIFDFQSYVLCLARMNKGITKTPQEWAKEYYQDDWIY